MIKKITSLISLLIGIGLLIVSFILAGSFSFWWILLIVGIIITAISVLEINALSKKSKEPIVEPIETKEKEKIIPEYRRKSTILSPHEQEFYSTLSGILSEKFLILPQMALVGVIDKITQTTYRNELFRIIDFLIVSKADFSPKLLIELNDSSHARADRVERDKKVKDICDRANMPLITIPLNERADTAKIKKLIKENILR